MEYAATAAPHYAAAATPHYAAAHYATTDAAAAAHYAAATSAPQPQPQPPYHYYTPPNPNPNFYSTGYETPAYQPDPYHANHGVYEGYAPAAAYGYAPSAEVGASSTFVNFVPEGVDLARGPGYNPMWKSNMKKRTFEDLQAKTEKLIQGGTAADAVKICAPCNVVCNSETVFAAHLAGEMHAQKVLGRHPLKGPNGRRTTIPSHVKVARMPFKTASQKKAKVIQPLSCDLCKLTCDTQEVLAIHRLGKKHMKNIKKLQDSLTAKPAEKGIAEGEKRRQGPQDLEAKKKAMLDNGTPADMLKVCTICNIVCSGQSVFDSHLAGQKHINLAKLVQQQIAPITTQVTQGGH